MAELVYTTDSYKKSRGRFIERWIKEYEAHIWKNKAKIEEHKAEIARLSKAIQELEDKLKSEDINPT